MTYLILLEIDSVKVYHEFEYHDNHDGFQCAEGCMDYFIFDIELVSIASLEHRHHDILVNNNLVSIA